MLGRLNHVAIAVKDAKKAARIYGGAFGARISEAVPLPDQRPAPRVAAVERQPVREAVGG